MAAKFKQKFLTPFWHWLKSKEGVILTLILAVAALLRFYHLEEGMHYMGDEGRDALIARQIITGQHFTLVGPPTSVGKLFLGPLYFYLVAPFLVLFRFSPLGPAVFVALLSLGTIGLVFWLTKQMFKSPVAGFLAAGLYAVSPMAVDYGRWPWNPNVMPFFVMVMMVSLWQTLEKKRPVWWLVTGTSLAFILQSHYLGLAAFPVLGLVLVAKRPPVKNKLYGLSGLVIFLVLMSPLLVFDLRHGFINVKGLLEIFQERQGSGFSLFDLLSRSFDRTRQIFGEFTGFGERAALNNLILVGLIAGWSGAVKNKSRWWLVGLWLVGGILFMGLYQGPFYRHYLEFLLPVPAVIIGGVLGGFWQKGKLGVALGLVGFLGLLIGFTPKTYKIVTQTIVPNVKTTKEIVDFVGKEAKGEPFNFALLAENNYDSAYRYFFNLWQMPADYAGVTKQLFVVCEGDELCQPEGNPKWEIAVFDAAYDGKIEIVNQWQFYDWIKIYQFKPK